MVRFRFALTHTSFANVFIPEPLNTISEKGAVKSSNLPLNVCASDDEKNKVPAVALKPPVVLLFVKLPAMVSAVGKVTAPEVDSMVKLVVLALLEKVFVPAPEKEVLANAEEPVMVPESDCADDPEK